MRECAGTSRRLPEANAPVRLVVHDALEGGVLLRYGVQKQRTVRDWTFRCPRIGHFTQGLFAEVFCRSVFGSERRCSTKGCLP